LCKRRRRRIEEVRRLASSCPYNRLPYTASDVRVLRRRRRRNEVEEDSRKAEEEKEE
jgi:hypothetical protein